MDDVSGLDATLHANLVQLKAYPPEQVEHLGLTFSAEQQLLGKVSVVGRVANVVCKWPRSGCLLSLVCVCVCVHTCVVAAQSAPRHAGTCCRPLCHRSSSRHIYQDTQCLLPPLARCLLQTVCYNLLPNGDDVPVTGTNRLLYIHLMADYFLNARLGRAASAFAAGLAVVLPPSWLRMFSPSELNQLISGGLDTGVDVDDMAK